MMLKFTSNQKKKFDPPAREIFRISEPTVGQYSSTYPDCDRFSHSVLTPAGHIFSGETTGGDKRKHILGMRWFFL